VGVKAKLRIELFAEEVVVAESDDTALWNRVFSAIATGNPELQPGDQNGGEQGTGDAIDPGKRGGSSKSFVEKFARELGVEVDELVGACNPEDEAPYIHLDEQYWETLRGHTGSRGKNAVAPVALAVTFLALWVKHRGENAIPTVADGKSVLDTIHLQDKNPSRSLRNCDWLQERGGGWVINPAMRSRAVKLAKAYIKRESPVEGK